MNVENVHSSGHSPVSVEILPIATHSAETTCTTSPEQIEVMKLEGYSGPMCNKHVHSTMTPSSRFHCLIGDINKPTTVKFMDITLYDDLLWRNVLYVHNVEIAHVTLTTPLSGKIFHRQCTKFEVSRFIRYEAMSGGAKCRKYGGLGQLGVTQGQPQCHHSIERIRLPIRH